MIKGGVEKKGKETYIGTMQLVLNAQREIEPVGILGPSRVGLTAGRKTARLAWAVF